MKKQKMRNKIDRALVEVLSQTLVQMKDIVILMFSAKTKSIKQKDDKVTTVDQ